MSGASLLLQELITRKPEQVIETVSIDAQARLPRQPLPPVCASTAVPVGEQLTGGPVVSRLSDGPPGVGRVTQDRARDPMPCQQRLRLGTFGQLLTTEFHFLKHVPKKLGMQRTLSSSPRSSTSVLSQSAAAPLLSNHSAARQVTTVSGKDAIDSCKLEDRAQLLVAFKSGATGSAAVAETTGSGSDTVAAHAGGGVGEARSCEPAGSEDGDTESVRSTQPPACPSPLPAGACDMDCSEDKEAPEEATEKAPVNRSPEGRAGEGAVGFKTSKLTPRRARERHKAASRRADTYKCQLLMAMRARQQCVDYVKVLDKVIKSTHRGYKRACGAMEHLEAQMGNPSRKSAGTVDEADIHSPRASKRLKVK